MSNTRFQELIIRKRDGQPLTPAQLRAIANGLASGAMSDAQAGAFAMAVLLNGLDDAERVALTSAMRDSGTRLEWDLPGPVVDKHSTGGIGDVVSLVLAPLLAAIGAFVPMISGRGLGHTGGTLDKLEALPGYSPYPDPDRFRRVVRDVGCAIIGQTDALAPADRRLYAIRDECGAVESIDLITASILSKKLAAGLDALVLDVKCGSGAFMSRREEASALAASLVAVGNGAGCRTSARITDMNAPLARAAGNGLEVRAALDVLTGQPGQECLRDLTLALCTALGYEQATLETALQSGAAAEKFAAMVRALGGPPDVLTAPGLAPAPIMRPVFAPQPGYVTAIDSRALGLAVIGLGGGRNSATDPIDPRVGLDALALPGAETGPDRPLAMVHAACEDSAERAAAMVQTAYRIGLEAPAPTPLIFEEVPPKDAPRNPDRP